MSIFNRKKRSKGSLVFAPGAFFDEVCGRGYTPITRIPEVVACCRKIAELLGSATIYLMNNTEDGDERIINELSRTIDINPMPNMTRSTWMEAIVMTLLLYGNGNAIVQPHTYQGYIQSLEPIAASRVGFLPVGYRDYKVTIDGNPKDPANLCHFVYNPDSVYLWKGKGIRLAIMDILENLVQARETEKAFLSSEYKPSLIVRVDALADEFSNPEGRQILIDDYMKPAKKGEPWLIPAEQFAVEQVRPLSLEDLAISDSVEVDKRTVAAVLGVPPFLLGVGEYDREAWNAFISGTVRVIAQEIEQELTKKLILSPNWYLKFNIRSLMDWDLQTIASVFGELRKQGVVDGNEVRDQIGMSPRDGLDELVMLENYLPTARLGDQKKLKQEGE